MQIDQAILDLCAKVTKKRPRTVIDHIIKHGFITNDELQRDYGYKHPPRAVRDVREEGIPIETFSVTDSVTKGKITAYRFDDPSKIKNGRIGGRRAFSKQFKELLISKYGEIDMITRDPVESRYLQIDHRIPYEVIGDSQFDESDPSAYMLIDASSQRAKSFSCEGCQNWRELLDPNICRTCYWATPENYDHIAMQQVRRIDIVWKGQSVEEFQRLQSEAVAMGVDVATLIKRKLQL